MHLYCGSALSGTLDELLEALRAIHCDAPAATGDSHLLPSGGQDTDGNAVSTPVTLPPLAPATRLHVVFFLRDFDECVNPKDAAVWLRWVHEVTKAGLAHVVIPTRASVTPTKVAALQALHGADSGDFVAIALRVAKGAVDATSAEDKLRELETEYGLGLRVRDPGGDELQTSASSDEARVVIGTVGNWWSDLVAVVERLRQRGLGSTSDSEERLALVRAVCEEFRQEVVDAILEHVRLDGSLDLQRIVLHSSTAGGGGGGAGTVASAPTDLSDGGDGDGADTEEKALRALESWKCLEVVSRVVVKSGLMMSPQQFLMKDTSRPPNCVPPVEALLPFGHRREGEAKFLELIDANVLFLRPKADVEVFVLPCAASDLIAPCWVETRPIVVSAFTEIWRSTTTDCHARAADLLAGGRQRNDTYFNAVQELERVATNKKVCGSPSRPPLLSSCSPALSPSQAAVQAQTSAADSHGRTNDRVRVQLREEIDLYAQEIDERQLLLTEQKNEFLLMQYKLTRAERVTRAAEVRVRRSCGAASWGDARFCSLGGVLLWMLTLSCARRQLSLLELEIDAKNAYLERLRLVLRS
ncbi:hypothetical protein PybrP1_004926 [[Pythium] brassicae (nom. inval.)]|nr:hypothetical protein PybrP1_004926 [[Pythium] brassicae (nom. inval.)]